MLVAAREELLQWGFRVLLHQQPWIGPCLVASDPARALSLARHERIDLALLGVHIGDDTGLGLTERLIASSPDTKVILLDPGLGISPYLARQAGAVGVLPCSLPAGELVATIHRAATGAEVFNLPKPATAELSSREREIVAQIASGHTNREIADRLYLSPNTIKQHASTLYRKLGARNRAEAVRRAQHLGLIG